MRIGWISLKSGNRSAFRSIPIGGAPSYRPSVSLQGLILGAVSLVQTQGPRGSSPASQQGTPRTRQLKSPRFRIESPQAAVPESAFWECSGPHPALFLLSVPPAFRSPPFSRRRHSRCRSARTLPRPLRLLSHPLPSPQPRPGAPPAAD